MYNKSNLEIKEAGKLILSITDFLASYFDRIGLAAAKIDVLAFNLVVIPALAKLTVYYSMTS